MNVKYLFLNEFTLMVKNIVVPDNARGAQHVIINACQIKGWKVILEYKVRDRGDGHAGFIDVVVYANGINVGIEIDNTYPRKKSIYKLVENDSDVRIIFLRNGVASSLPAPYGIDLMYPLHTAIEP